MTLRESKHFAQLTCFSTRITGSVLAPFRSPCSSAFLLSFLSSKKRLAIDKTPRVRQGKIGHKEIKIGYGTECGRCGVKGRG